MSIPATLMRGGTSKCWLFDRDAVPADRDALAEPPHRAVRRRRPAPARRRRRRHVGHVQGRDRGPERRAGHRRRLPLRPGRDRRARRGVGKQLRQLRHGRRAVVGRAVRAGGRRRRGHDRPHAEPQHLRGRRRPGRGRTGRRGLGAGRPRIRHRRRPRVRRPGRIHDRRPLPHRIRARGASSSTTPPTR
ncbi:hypothetical protein WDV94_14420 [Clavibacter tessellarius]